MAEAAKAAATNTSAATAKGSKAPASSKAKADAAAANGITARTVSLKQLAAALAAKVLAHREELSMPAAFRARPDAATRYGLINHHREDQAPAAVRLTELLEANLRAAGVEVPQQ